MVVMDVVHLSCRETQQVEDKDVDVVWNQVRYLTTLSNQKVFRAKEVFRLVKTSPYPVGLAYP